MILWLLSATAVGMPVAFMPAAFDPTHVKAALAAVLIAATVAVRLWYGVGHNGIVFLPRPMVIAMGAVLGTAILSAGFSGSRWAVGGELLRVTGCFALAIMTAEYVAISGKPRRIIIPLLLGAIAVCSYGIIQQVGFDPFTWDVGAETGRIVGTFANAMFFAGYLNLLLPVAISIFLSNLPGRISRSNALPGKRSALVRSVILYALVAIAIAVCLIWTYTRGAWLGQIIGLCILGVLGRTSNGATGTTRRRRLLWGTVVAVMAVTLAFGIVLTASPHQRARLSNMFSLTSRSNATRVLIWRGALNVFRDHPLLGTGPGTFWIVFPQYQSPHFYQSKSIESRTMIVTHAHNELLQILSETGALGGLAWLWLLGVVAVLGIRANRNAQSKETRLLTAGIAGGMVAFLVHSLTNTVFSIPSLSVAFWLLAGVLLGIGHVSGASPRHAQLTCRTAPGTLARAGIAGLLLVAVGGICYMSGRLVISGYCLGRGETALRAGKLQDAEKWLVDAEQTSWRDVRVLYRLGHVYSTEGQYGQALHVYRSIERLAPNYARLHYNLGVVLSHLGDWQGAVAEFERELRLEDSPRVHFALDFARQHVHVESK